MEPKKTHGRTRRLLPSGSAVCRLVVFLLLPLGAFLAAMALMLAWVPIHASAVIFEQPKITEGAPGASPSGPYEPLTVEIHAEAAGVELRPPAPISAALRAGLSQVELGGWRRDPGDPDQLVSGPNATMRIAGAFSSLDFAFLTGPNAGRVEMRMPGAESVSVDLRADFEDVRTLTVDSGQQRVTVSRRFAWQGHRLSFGQDVDRIEGVTLASLPVTYRPIRSLDGNLTGLKVTSRQVLVALADTAWRAGPLLVVGAVVTAVALGLGTLLEVLLVRSAQLTWAQPERLAAGLALGLSILGALNYYLPVSVIAPAVLLLGAFGLFLETKRRRSPRWRMNFEGAVLAGAAFAFVALPFVVTDRWAIGHLQTDVHDTFNLTQLFWNRAALEAHTDFGNGFRLLDYSARAAVAGWSRPSDAVVVLRLVTSLLMVSVIWALAARLCRQPIMRWAFTLGVGFSAPLLSLYAEGYMTRHFFAMWMIIGIALLTIALHDQTRGWAAWAPASAAFGVAAATVPPYFIVAPAAVLALLLLRFGLRQSLNELAAFRKPALGAAALLAAVSVPNLLWLRNAADAERYIPALNALVRFTIVPFYGTITFPATLLGVLPFHANTAHLLGLPNGTVAPEPVLVVARLLENPLPCAAVLGLIVFTLLSSTAGAVRKSRQDLQPALVDATWLSGLAVILLGFAGLRLTQWEEQTYFVIMWAWTLAPVGVTLAAIGMARASTAPLRLLRLPAITGLALLLLVNVASTVLESSRWLEHPRGVIAALWHFDLVSDLSPFSRALDTGRIPVEGKFKIVERASALTGTDDDRVLGNVLVGLLTANGHECVNCRRTADTFNLLLDDEEIDNRFTTLVIGGRSCPGVVGYRGERFVICAPTS